LKNHNFKTNYTILKSSTTDESINDRSIENKVVEFPNNFLSKEDKVVETIIQLDHHLNTGYSKHLIFNGIRIEHRNLNLLSPIEAKVSLNFPYLKMQFSLDGHYSYKSSNNKSLDVNVKKGHHQIFYFPELKNGIVSLSSKGKHYKSFEISLSLDFIHRAFRNSWEVLDLLGYAIKKETPLVYGIKSQVISPEIYLVIEQITNCNVKNELRRTYLEAKVIELLILQINDLYKSNNKDLNPEVKHYSKIKAAKIFIEDNIDSDLTIPIIAKKVGLNINYLKTEFKELYNQTIFQYLTLLRMEHADHLIKYTNLTVSEIAQKVGYKYPQHFTKTFKKFSGKTPSVIRKKDA